jgi:hypothetical protein
VGFFRRLPRPLRSSVGWGCLGRRVGPAEICPRRTPVEGAAETRSPALLTLGSAPSSWLKDMSSARASRSKSLTVHATFPDSLRLTPDWWQPKIRATSYWLNPAVNTADETRSVRGRVSATATLATVHAFSAQSQANLEYLR